MLNTVSGTLCLEARNVPSIVSKERSLVVQTGVEQFAEGVFAKATLEVLETSMTKMPCQTTSIGYLLHQKLNQDEAPPAKMPDDTHAPETAPRYESLISKTQSNVRCEYFNFWVIV